MRFTGRRLGLQTVVIMQMFPQFLAVIALFLLMDSLGGYIPFFGIDTLAGLILVHLGGALGVNTYLMYGYFNTIPKSLDEAAKLDGASHARVFFTIILPLVRPILVVVGVLSFIGVTGDFIIASVMLKSPENQTVAVGAVRLVNGERRNQVWGVFTAGAVLAAIPLMALWLGTQKHIVTGLSSGAVK
jgi:arabinogalactan oligomer/maltooligosaccharide transport system permease protein